MGSCGCGCQPADAPCRHDNPPGRPALAFRLGTQPAFLRRMKLDLHRQEVATESGQVVQPLRQLTSRAPDDLSIALLDAWACAADVLTFYQERIVQEGFLRTAQGRDAVLELARSIGFEPKPGLAAEVDLVLTMDGADPTLRESKIPKGTRVRSVPGPGESPQTFETQADLAIRPEWNAARGRGLAPPSVRMGLDRLRLRGLATGLQPGDAVLVVGRERMEYAGSERWDQRFVREVLPDRDRGVTVVTLDRPLGSQLRRSPPTEMQPHVFALRQRASLFGHNAPQWDAMGKEFRKEYEAKVTNTPAATGTGSEWPGFPLYPNSGVAGDQDKPPERPELLLDASYPKVLAGSWLVLRLPGNANPADVAARYVELYRAAEATTSAQSLFTLSGKATRVLLDTNENLRLYRHRRRDTLVLAQSEELEVAETPIEDPVEGTSVPLAGKVTAIPEGRRVVVTGKRFRARRREGPFAIQAKGGAQPPPAGEILEVVARSPTVSGKVLWLKPPTVQREEWHTQLRQRIAAIRQAKPAPEALLEALAKHYPGNLGKLGDFSARRDQVAFELFDGEGWLTLVPGKPALEIVLADASKFPIGGLTRLYLGDVRLRESWTLEGRNGTRHELEAEWGAIELLPAELDPAIPSPPLPDAPPPQPRLTELAEAARTVPQGDHTILELRQALAHSYDPASVVVHANVAHATHGETIREILGSGDARIPNQAFTPKAGPVTQLAAATPRGAQAELAVHVGGSQWKEVPFLYGRQPDAPAYALRFLDDGKATLIFGDGEQGRRLPSGPANVVATYRRGLGPEGNLPPGRLTLLQDRPLGLKESTNLLEAAGGAAPATLEEARRAAPATVLALDRTVSLQDYADLALTFAGVAQAQATRVTAGEDSVVHVTVAPEGGRQRVPDTQKERLREALRLAGDPFQRVVVADHDPVRFWFHARVEVPLTQEAAPVLAAARSALEARFDAARRTFGQPVFAGEVLAALQGVAGVSGVVLLSLAREKPLATSRPDRIEAQAARWDDSSGTVQRAELLVWDAAATVLEVVQR